MKKNIFIICIALTIFSLTAYSYTIWGKMGTNKKEKPCGKLDLSKHETTKLYEKKDTPDFIYEVSSRFVARVTKEQLHQAKSIIDLVPMNSIHGIESFENVKIAVVSDGEDKFEMGESEVINSKQLSLLLSTDYSCDFYVEALCMRKNSVTGEIKKESFVYYITVVPEKEAEFIDGQMILLDYLKMNSKKEVEKVNMDQIKPGKAYFTVMQNGEIANVILGESSGYSSLDKKMIELISNMPGKWIPATNSKGIKVDQKLVFFFGYMGC